MYESQGYQPIRRQFGSGPPQTSLSTALAAQATDEPRTPVQIPDDPDGVLSSDHPAYSLLNTSGLVLQRQIEMMNIFLGFEQANRYLIMNEAGGTIGYLIEQDHGFGSAMTRQLFRTHRSFTSHVFDLGGREVLRIHRPFTWINSKIRIYDPVSGLENAVRPHDSAAIVAAGSFVPITSPLPLADMRVIGETQQIWAPLRRKYALFTHRQPENRSLLDPDADADADADGSGMMQFASIDAPFLSWDFNLLSADSTQIGSVNRSFRGLGREIFTDTGAYALRMDSVASDIATVSASSSELQSDGRVMKRATALSLDQRAVMLASAVSIDFDYFSRHSGAGAFVPIPFWTAGAGEAGAGAAGAGAVGATETGISGAGTMAGAGALEGLAGSAAGALGRVEAAEGLGAGVVGAAGAAAAAKSARDWGAVDGEYDRQSPQTWDPYASTPQHGADPSLGTYPGDGGQAEMSHPRDSHVPGDAVDGGGAGDGDDGAGFDWTDLF